MYIIYIYTYIYNPLGKSKQNKQWPICVCVCGWWRIFAKLLWEGSCWVILNAELPWLHNWMQAQVVELRRNPQICSNSVLQHDWYRFVALAHIEEVVFCSRSPLDISSRVLLRSKHQVPELSQSTKALSDSCLSCQVDRDLLPNPPASPTHLCHFLCLNVWVYPCTFQHPES